MTAARKAKRDFGSVDKMPSGRYRARYRTPGSVRGAKFINAPHTFTTIRDADTWLAIERAKIARGGWRSVHADVTFGEYAQQWMDAPPRPQKQRTSDDYRRLLDNHILGTFENRKLKSITASDVRAWYRLTCVDAPTQRAHCYSLLKLILKTAVNEEIISENPCKIIGAATIKRISKTEPATLEELDAIRNALPYRYQLMITLAAWCALRFGELIELRVSDFDFDRGVVKVRRAASWVKNDAVVGAPTEVDEADLAVTVPLIGTPKTQAGVRDVAIPPDLIPEIKTHIKRQCETRSSLLFPSARNPSSHMRPATLYKVYYPARSKAGRDDLRFHDLRHTGAVLAAIAGATTADLMERLGHTTERAAMRYQHSARGRQTQIAQLLSDMRVTAKQQG